MNEETTNERLPSLVSRVKATFIDTLVIIILGLIFSQIFEAMGYEGEQYRKIAFLIVILYEPVLTSFYKTVGQAISGIKVRRIGNHDKKILLPMALLRYIFKILLGVISLITVTSDKKMRAIHDMVGSSIVLKA